jgi:hypothetical protein
LVRGSAVIDVPIAKGRNKAFISEAIAICDVFLQKWLEGNNQKAGFEDWVKLL